MKDWAVPVVLGLVAAGLVTLIGPPTTDRPGMDAQGAADPGWYAIIPAADAPRHRSALLFTAPLDIHAGWYDNGTMYWDTPRPSCAVDDIRCLSTVSDTSIWTIYSDGQGRPSPRVGIDGSVIGATWLIFEDAPDGQRLLATDLPAAELSRFALHPDFSRFTPTTWYLGTGPAPNGTQAPPFYRDVIAAALHGTPVGGVQSVHLPTHQFDWLYGPLWITARVESVA